MTTATTTRSGAGPAEGAQRAADVLVVFGITGDLAKVMTLRSLYRLEARGLLTCPIVGVAVDDWTADDLRERAREAIVDGGEHARPGGVRPLRARGSRTCRATSRTPATFARARRRAHGRADAGLLSRDPAVPVRHRRRRPRRRRADRAAPASSSRSRSATTSSRPARSPTSCTSTSTSASSTGSTTSSGRWASTRSSTCGSRTRSSSRSGIATTSRACRSRWPRTSASRTAGTSTTRSARCATWSSTT